MAAAPAAAAADISDIFWQAVCDIAAFVDDGSPVTASILQLSEAVHGGAALCVEARVLADHMDSADLQGLQADALPGVRVVHAGGRAWVHFQDVTTLFDTAEGLLVGCGVPAASPAPQLLRRARERIYATLDQREAADLLGGLRL